MNDLDSKAYFEYINEQQRINAFCEKEFGTFARFDGIYSPLDYFESTRPQSRIVIILKEAWGKKDGIRWDPVSTPENSFSIYKHPDNKVATKLVNNLHDYFGNLRDEKGRIVLKGIGYINISKQVNESSTGRAPITKPRFLQEQINKYFDSIIIPQLKAMLPTYVILCGVIGSQPLLFAIIDKLEKAYGVPICRKALCYSQVLEINKACCPIKKISLWQGKQTPLFIQTYHPSARGKKFYPTSNLIELLDHNHLVDWNQIHSLQQAQGLR